MDDRHRHEAQVLMADPTRANRHKVLGASEEEVGQRARSRYPHAVALCRAKRPDRRRGVDLHHEQDTRGRCKEDFGRWPR